MQDECKNVLTEKSSSEDGTGNFASVLRDQGKEVQKTGRLWDWEEALYPLQLL